MPLHVRLERKSPSANGAGKGLYGTVSGLVVPKVVLLHETHAAGLAGEAPHLRVDEHVVSKLARVLKQTFAHFALELMSVGRALGTPTAALVVVVFGDVGSEVARKGKATSAERARKTAASCVSHQVALEVGHLEKCVITLRTAMWSPALVDEEVRIQMSLLLKRLVTHVTFVSLQSRVAQQVRLQVVLLRENFAAHVALPRASVARRTTVQWRST